MRGAAYTWIGIAWLAGASFGCGVKSAERAAPVMIEAPADGAVDAVVRRERAAAAAGTSLVVYVGATWCEPCERFKRALAAGELDDALAGVVFLGFDSDRDDARLEAAGYGSSVIPLFVVPEVSGRGGERRFAGSIKGPGAVRDIAGKLRALLTGV